MRAAIRPAVLALAWSMSVGACSTQDMPPARTSATTHGSIALANLDRLIEQGAGSPASLDLLLLRAQLLGDVEVFDRVAALADAQAEGGDDLARRARARAAVHRFADALADLRAAESAGGARAGATLAAPHASVLVAMGRARDALPGLEADALRRPGFATHGALARAYAAVGRLEEADALYARALDELDTTSPFPAAALWFARGLMWSEQGADPGRGAALYARALRLLPQYVAANVHLAELEIARGELAAATARLQPVAAASKDPEALALLGQLELGAGRADRGRAHIEEARRRYERLLARHPAAFADHAAEFFLGPGADPERAYAWARRNLDGRQTRRAYLLAIRAARATQRLGEARALEEAMHRSLPPRAA